MYAAAGIEDRRAHAGRGLVDGERLDLADNAVVIGVTAVDGDIRKATGRKRGRRRRVSAMPPLKVTVCVLIGVVTPYVGLAVL